MAVLPRQIFTRHQNNIFKSWRPDVTFVPAWMKSVCVVLVFFFPLRCYCRLKRMGDYRMGLLTRPSSSLSFYLTRAEQWLIDSIWWIVHKVTLKGGATFTSQPHSCHIAVLLPSRSSPPGKQLTLCKWYLVGIRGLGLDASWPEHVVMKYRGCSIGFPLRYVIMAAQMSTTYIIKMRK